MPFITNLGSLLGSSFYRLFGYETNRITSMWVYVYCYCVLIVVKGMLPKHQQIYYKLLFLFLFS